MAAGATDTRAEIRRRAAADKLIPFRVTGLAGARAAACRICPRRADLAAYRSFATAAAARGFRACICVAVLLQDCRTGRLQRHRPTAASECDAGRGCGRQHAEEALFLR